MVRVPESFGGDFCIDSRETTNEQYATLLASGAHPTLHPNCAEVHDFTPLLKWPYEPGQEMLPVVGVTWCEAQAFCVASGKRLCGELGTGEFSELMGGEMLEEVNGRSELASVCSKGGSQAFVYSGDTWQPGLCNDDFVDVDEPLRPANTTDGCEGGYSGVYQLQGNVLEWQAQCLLKDDEVSDPYCFVLGLANTMNGCLVDTGELSFEHSGAPMTGATSVRTGIRCCADTMQGP